MLLRPAASLRAASSLGCSRPTLRLASMPLRAKITHPALRSRQAMSNSTSAAPEKAVEGPPQDPVLFGSRYGVRTIELNRPAALNALNQEMVETIVPRLQEWEKSKLANVIVIKGAGETAFCAGGDVKALAEQNMTGPEGQQRSIRYFGLEYQLDHLVATYSKPYVAFIDGFTMGGGVGLSVHAPFRIATERTVFAMPETTIGFFPDVGGSFFLPRMDGEMGTYLALTSEWLKGVHVFYSGIATHYIHSSSLPDVEDRLAELNFSDSASRKERFDIVNSTIEEFVTGIPENEPFTLSGARREAIDRCFRFNTIEEILAALDAEASDSEWAQKTKSTLLSRSPTSLRVSLKQLRLGATKTISETFHREYHLAARFMRHPDFVEGVSARLVSRPPRTPHWQPPTLAEVPDAAIAQDFFVQQKDVEPFHLLTVQGEYLRYPYEGIGLPSEDSIKRTILGAGGVTMEEAVEGVVEQYAGKLGVRGKVREVLRRRTEKDERGFLRWKEPEGARASPPEQGWF